tara:strand:+ start:153 stop:623 length:471 start_codon:yes stop_codon:yes gene_type:complete
MFGSMRMIMIGVMVAGLAGAGAYVFKLRADNATLKANQIKLESAVSEQKELIENQKKDFKEILDANNKMNELVNVLKKDLENLDKRFNKKNRDVGKLAIQRTESIERITNKGSANATRCIEIASGSPLTEEEKNATRKTEINTECPSIANPNYVPY